MCLVFALMMMGIITSRTLFELFESSMHGCPVLRVICRVVPLYPSAIVLGYHLGGDVGCAVCLTMIIVITVISSAISEEIS